ncbi:MAG TPA: heavy-metal-associated domain-containing protein [Microbacteriaceae bacterium]
MSELTQDYFVDGMTCSHCVASVSEELSELDGVASVAVELKPGSSSRVSVASATPLDEDAVRAAIEEAGYELSAAPR